MQHVHHDKERRLPTAGANAAGTGLLNDRIPARGAPDDLRWRASRRILKTFLQSVLLEYTRFFLLHFAGFCFHPRPAVRGIATA